MRNAQEIAKIRDGLAGISDADILSGLESAVGLIDELKRLRRLEAAILAWNNELGHDEELDDCIAEAREARAAAAKVKP